MAHYAFIDEHNVVVGVIVGRDETDTWIDGVEYDWEQHYGELHGLLCKRTSYNTRANVHAFGGSPYRLNYAGVGWIWRPDLNPPDGGFVQPGCVFPSWTFNESTGVYDPPVAHPESGLHDWDEDSQRWVPRGN